jgi:hypothetical protein
MSVEDFRAWLRMRNERETVPVIAESLGASRLVVYQWMWGTRRPGGIVRKFAALLAGYPRELEPGLPTRPYKPRKPLRHSSTHYPSLDRRF